MSRLLALCFVGAGGVSILDWLVAGWLAEGNPDAVLATKISQSPAFLIVGLVFMGMGLLIACLFGPGERPSTRKTARRLRVVR